MSSDPHKKSPSTGLQILIWLLTVAFMTGIAYASFATKDWVDSRIDAHDKATKEILQDIKKQLDRMEGRQWESKK